MVRYKVELYGYKNANKVLVAVEVDAMGQKQALKKAIKKSKRIREAKTGTIDISKYDKKQKIFKFVSASYV